MLNDQIIPNNATGTLNISENLLALTNEHDIDELKSQIDPSLSPT